MKSFIHVKNIQSKKKGGVETLVPPLDPDYGFYLITKVNTFLLYTACRHEFTIYD